MNKDLRKSYECLDLKYSATKEDVIARKNALIKIFNAQAMENKKPMDKKIDLVEKSAEIICDNIDNNGIPKDVSNHESSNQSLVSLFIILLFVIFVCFMSFYMFL